MDCHLSGLENQCCALLEKGYPHAYEAGANHMKYIVNNLQGKVNEPQIGEYESG